MTGHILIHHLFLACLFLASTHASDTDGIDDYDDCDQIQYRDSFSDPFYSQAVLVENKLYISGQFGWNGTHVVDGIASQVNQTFDNIENVLTQYDATIDNVFKVVSYVTQSEYNNVLTEIKTQRYPSWQPTWSAIGASFLFFDTMFVEIEMIAYIPQRKNKNNNICCMSDPDSKQEKNE